MNLELTLRDMLVQRLTMEFGAPVEVGRNYRWTIRCSKEHQPINIALNSWHTPHKFHLWVFDPNDPRSKGVRSFPMTGVEAIDPVVTSIRKCIMRQQGLGKQRGRRQRSSSDDPVRR